MLEKLKALFKSWTINYGLALMLVGSLEINFHYLKGIIPEKWYGAIFVLVGLVVVVLRFKTTTSLMEKK